jgi:hypothetical protein
MQDEHLMKLRSEARQEFFAGVTPCREPAGSIEQAYEYEALIAICQHQLARLLSWAIPVGFLTGTVAAALAVAANMPPAPKLAPDHHPAAASFTLPYAA